MALRALFKSQGRVRDCFGGRFRLPLHALWITDADSIPQRRTVDYFADMRAASAADQRVRIGTPELGPCGR